MHTTMTPTQQKIRKFANSNLPEYLLREEHTNILLDLISVMYGDIQDSDDLLYSLVSIDKVPEEYLPDIAFTIGYDIDPTLPTEYQRMFMKKFLSSRRNRGTAQSIKLVGASYARNLEDFLTNPATNEIEVIEYGINDQSYTPGLKEIWQPGAIAVTIAENSDFVKSKLRNTIPAGMRLNLNTLQALDMIQIDAKTNSNYSTTRELYTAMHRLVSNEVRAVGPIGNYYPYTLTELDQMLRVEIGFDYLTILEVDAKANHLAKQSEIFVIRDSLTKLEPKISSAERYVESIAGASNGFLLETTVHPIGEYFDEQVKDLFKMQRDVSASVDETSRISMAVVEFEATTNLSTSDISLQVDSGIEAYQKDEFVYTESAAEMQFSVASAVNRLVDYFPYRVEDINEIQLRPDAEIAYYYR